MSMPAWKRQLFFIHRWLGIVLCAFFALWFFSGIFMMYVQFPQLTRVERLAAGPSLDFSEARLDPAAAVARVRSGDFDTIGAPQRNRAAQPENPDAAADVSEIQLGMLLGEPVYRLYPDGSAQPRVVSATSGEVFAAFTEEQATVVVHGFAKRRGLDAGNLRYLGAIQTDQWTVSSAMNPHRPLHHFALQDEAGTELYVSSTTGEVVRDSDRLERTLNYFAAVTHWLYPTFIRRHVEFWGWMIDFLSGAGVFLGITGLWIGVMRLQRRRKAGMSMIPYRGMMRWHHITGLVFGVVAITWVFSGLLSMNPGDLNPGRSPSAEQRLVFAGKALTPEDFVRPIASPSDLDVIEAKLVHVDGAPFYRASARNGSEQLIPASQHELPAVSMDELVERARLLLPDWPIEQAAMLEEYDDYWYSRDPENGRTLPVLRVRFADPDKTWFYIDPEQQAVIGRMNRTNRVYRWLYNGLHSWDIRWLYERRPLWDIAVIAFSLGGLALSLIGIVVSWKRLRLEKHLAQVRRRHRQAATTPVAG